MMLNFLHAVVELIDLGNQLLVFRSNRTYREGSEVKVRVAVHGSRRTLPVRVIGARAPIYHAVVLTDLQGLDVTGEQADHEARSAVWHRTRLRVRSRRLPGYGAMTVEVGNWGVQLETTGPLTVGATIPLTLELEPTVLSCDARVIWCGATGRGFRAGLQFLPTDPAELERAIAVVAERARAEVKQLLAESMRTS